MPNNTENEAGTKVTSDSLKARDILPIANWHEWLKLWREANNLQTMEGLLHVGFSMVMDRTSHEEKEYDHVDRVLFYLSVADGWLDFGLLRNPTADSGEDYRVGRDRNGNAIRKTQPELRQMVAEKAFNILCQNFFKLDPELYKNSSERLTRFFENLVFSDKVFPILMKFFCPEVSGTHQRVPIRNLPRRTWRDISHNEELVIDFFVNLASYLFKWQAPEIASWKEESEKIKHKALVEKMCSRVAEAKLWMIEILVYINRLDVLNDPEKMFELDKLSLARLKEIAMRTELNDIYHPVEEDRSVASLEEACYAGSKAAVFLLIYRVRLDVHKHLLMIKRAQEDKDEALRKLRRLSGKKS